MADAAHLPAAIVDAVVALLDQGRRHPVGDRSPRERVALLPVVPQRPHPLGTTPGRLVPRVGPVRNGHGPVSGNVHARSLGVILRSCCFDQPPPFRLEDQFIERWPLVQPGHDHDDANQNRFALGVHRVMAVWALGWWLLNQEYAGPPRLPGTNRPPGVQPDLSVALMIAASSRSE
jgi:hypothetical protein